MRYGVVFLAALLSGCATQSIGYIDSDSFGTGQDPNLHPVVITAVDGQMRSLDRIRLEPGTHRVTAYSTQGYENRRAIRERSFDIEVPACRSLSLAAQHRDALSEDWELVIVDERPVQRCTD